jgi:FAD/FMN-containing dehydrogenase
MARTWRNWSGSVVSRPRRWLKPPSEERLQEQLAAAATGDWPVRVVGAGHSSSGVVEVPGTLISLDQLRGVLSVDAENHQATVYAGTPLQELGRQLYDHDLTLPNFGDVATQTIGGAIGTATHGTGKRLRNLSQLMVKARVVTADGALREIGPDDPDALHAL